jgi:hypothetical protein
MTHRTMTRRLIARIAVIMLFATAVGLGMGMVSIVSPTPTIAGCSARC